MMGGINPESIKRVEISKSRFDLLFYWMREIAKFVKQR
jgi:hypothetical protein